MLPGDPRRCRGDGGPGRDRRAPGSPTGWPPLRAGDARARVPRRQVLFQWNWLRNEQSGWTIPRPIIGPFDMNNNKTFAMFMLILVGIDRAARSATSNVRRGAVPSPRPGRRRSRPTRRASRCCGSSSACSRSRRRSPASAVCSTRRTSSTSATRPWSWRRACSGWRPSSCSASAGRRPRSWRASSRPRRRSIFSSGYPLLVRVRSCLERHRVGGDPGDPVRPRRGAARPVSGRRDLAHRDAEPRAPHEAPGPSAPPRSASPCRSSRRWCRKRTRRPSPKPSGSDASWSPRARCTSMRAAADERGTADGGAGAQRPPRRVRRRRGAPRHRPRGAGR